MNATEFFETLFNENLFHIILILSWVIGFLFMVFLYTAKKIGFRPAFMSLINPFDLEYVIDFLAKDRGLIYLSVWMIVSYLLLGYFFS